VRGNKEPFGLAVVATEGRRAIDLVLDGHFLAAFEVITKAKEI